MSTLQRDSREPQVYRKRSTRPNSETKSSSENNDWIFSIIFKGIIALIIFLAILISTKSSSPICKKIVSYATYSVETQLDFADIYQNTLKFKDYLLYKLFDKTIPISHPPTPKYTASPETTPANLIFPTELSSKIFTATKEFTGR